MTNVIVLNADFQYLTSISWKKAITLFYKGKAEIIKYTDRIISNFDKSIQLQLPQVIKLIKYVQIKYNTIAPYSKYNVFIRDDFTCQYCNDKSQPLTIDHVIPKSKGGKTEYNNVVSSCKKCNLLKDCKTLQEAKLKLNKYPYEPTLSEIFRKKLVHKGYINIIKDFYE
jgi:5-methylcytosine-specific restriction endonuclease McrA